VVVLSGIARNLFPATDALLPYCRMEVTPPPTRLGILQLSYQDGSEATIAIRRFLSTASGTMLQVHSARHHAFSVRLSSTAANGGMRAFLKGGAFSVLDFQRNMGECSPDRCTKAPRKRREIVKTRTSVLSTISQVNTRKSSCQNQRETFSVVPERKCPLAYHPLGLYAVGALCGAEGSSGATRSRAR